MITEIWKLGCYLEVCFGFYVLTIFENRDLEGKDIVDLEDASRENFDKFHVGLKILHPEHGLLIGVSP